MPEVETELGAENAILAAVMGDETAPPDVDDLDRVSEREVREPEDAKVETEEKVEAKEEAADDGEDFIEVPTEEGKEPLRFTVKEAVEALQGRQQFEAEKGRVIEEITGQARQQVTQAMTQTRSYIENVSQHAQAVLSQIAPPQPPPVVMLDPNSQHYNPDQYHLQRGLYEQAMGRYQNIQQQAVALGERARQQQEWEDSNRRSQEDQILMRLWPETRDDAYSDKVWADVKQHYGFSEDEIYAALSNHKAALVVRDALAYRAMKNGAPQVKEQVQKAAPKLVRSKQEAKGSPAQARDTSGKFTGAALAELRKTNSDDAAAAFFAGLSRAGRI